MQGKPPLAPAAQLWVERRPDQRPVLAQQAGIEEAGTIVLHPVGKVDGYLISPTALAAPKDARKAFDRAQQLAHKNKPAEAIQSYQNAVGIDPGYAAGWYELGRLQAANHKIDDARRSFNSALEVDP